MRSSDIDFKDQSGTYKNMASQKLFLSFFYFYEFNHVLFCISSLEVLATLLTWLHMKLLLSCFLFQGTCFNIWSFLIHPKFVFCIGLKFFLQSHDYTDGKSLLFYISYVSIPSVSSVMVHHMCVASDPAGEEASSLSTSKLAASNDSRNRAINTFRHHGQNAGCFTNGISYEFKVETIYFNIPVASDGDLALLNAKRTRK